MRILKYFPLLLAFWLPSTVFAQDQGEILPLDSYRQVENALAKDLQNHKNDLANQMEAKRLEYQADANKKMNEIQDASAQIRVMLWFFGGITFVGLISIFWGGMIYVKRKVLKFVQEQVDLEYPKLVDKKLRKIFEDDAEQLTELIQDKSFEQQMKESVPFMVLAADNSDKKEAKQMIKETLGFKKAEFILLEDYDPAKKFPMVIVYDLNDKLVNGQENKLQTLLADAKQLDDGTIYLLALQSHWQALNHYRAIANAANSAFTLYGQMLDTLSFIYLSKKN